MTKTNAASIEDNGKYHVQHDPAAQPAASNPTFEQAQESMREALGYIADATTLIINVPSPEGDFDVDFDSGNQDGEVVTVKCKQVNRFRRLQTGLMSQILRQLDYAIEQENKELAGIQRDVRSAMGNLQRAQDPARLRDFIESKLKWADVIADRVSWAMGLRDAADAAYLDLVGTVYTPAEKRVKADVVIPNAPSADPLLARAAAFANGR